ncbi:hypothetical protein PPERSA_01239 [Pseudocohnilembus persalinus]|uniref:Uncharacterized protein n=1 Tax=Pseudocohnilembus persalinus TaxID=266149 RepID=A0A0V0R9J1_PSEPJ|nr:hypothetical protein PPERSA_01239 [Pseudocohnilembus persalinus]|eukprot:KRX11040.1 hypothetical protein PPERSA_01239 [Pseudocohnilembus persalinus]
MGNCINQKNKIHNKSFVESNLPQNQTCKSPSIYPTIKANNLNNNINNQPDLNNPYSTKQASRFSISTQNQNENSKQNVLQKQQTLPYSHLQRGSIQLNDTKINGKNNSSTFLNQYSLGLQQAHLKPENSNIKAKNSQYYNLDMALRRKSTNSKLARQLQKQEVKENQQLREQVIQGKFQLQLETSLESSTLLSNRRASQLQQKNIASPIKFNKSSIESLSQSPDLQSKRFSRFTEFNQQMKQLQEELKENDSSEDNESSSNNSSQFSPFPSKDNSLKQKNKKDSILETNNNQQQQHQLHSSQVLQLNNSKKIKIHSLHENNQKQQFDKLNSLKNIKIELTPSKFKYFQSQRNINIQEQGENEESLQYKSSNLKPKNNNKQRNSISIDQKMNQKSSQSINECQNHE